MGTTAPLKTVLRAFEVVRILDEREGATPSEVAAELDVTRATAHDYLVSLTEAGYASRDDGVYRTGYRFLQTGNRRKYRSWLFRASTPAMVGLYEEVNEPVQLDVEENGEWVLLHLEDERDSIGISPYAGFRTPLHTRASGKVILAELPDERRDEILGEGSLDASTDETITDPTALRRELDQIARDGYAVDWDQEATGIGFAACPISVDDRVLVLDSLPVQSLTTRGVLRVLRPPTAVGGGRNSDGLPSTADSEPASSDRLVR